MEFISKNVALLLEGKTFQPWTTVPVAGFKRFEWFCKNNVPYILRLYFH